MKDLYLHIGRAKTGSTAIQSSLWKDRLFLAQQGFCYPSSGTGVNPQSHSTIALQVHQNSTYSETEVLETRDTLEQETNSFQKVILSSEGFQNVTNTERMDVFFRRDENKYRITALCYFREFLDVAQSAYTQRIQSTNLVSNFDQFCAFFSKFSPANFVSHWKTFADNTIFFSYENERSSNVNIVDSFYKAIEATSEGKQNLENTNPSIAGNLLIFKLLLNTIFPHKLEYYLALKRISLTNKRFRGAPNISDYQASRLRSKYPNYNSELETIVGQFPLRSFENRPPVFCGSTWNEDVDRFLSEPEFADLRNVAELRSHPTGYVNLFND